MALRADTLHVSPCAALRDAYDATVQHMQKLKYPYDALPPATQPPPTLPTCGPLPSETLRALRRARKMYSL